VTATVSPTTETSPGIDTRWWRDAVVYQVYVRSFSDANGDGVGDLAGVRARLPYLRELGVDALWFNPWYPSPQADAGYDIADHRRSTTSSARSLKPSS
jgi:alpha-glucosidase